MQIIRNTALLGQESNRYWLRRSGEEVISAMEAKYTTNMKRRLSGWMPGKRIKLIKILQTKTNNFVLITKPNADYNNKSFWKT